MNVSFGYFSYIVVARTQIHIISGSENAKSKAMYDEVNRQVEKWCEIGYFVTVILSPLSFILPKFTVSVFAYFTTDLGNEALVLPLPTWYKLKKASMCSVIESINFCDFRLFEGFRGIQST